MLGRIAKTSTNHREVLSTNKTSYGRVCAVRPGCKIIPLADFVPGCWIWRGNQLFKIWHSGNLHPGLRVDRRALGEWPRRRVGTRSPFLLRNPLRTTKGPRSRDLGSVAALRRSGLVSAAPRSDPPAASSGGM